MTHVHGGAFVLLLTPNHSPKSSKTVCVVLSFPMLIILTLLPLHPSLSSLVFRRAPLIFAMSSRPPNRKQQRPFKSSNGNTNQQALARRDKAASQSESELSTTNDKWFQKRQTPPGDPPKKKERTAAVRLDINLNAEVHLKARLHGDLTIALNM